jgi:hypothetical protein
MWKGEKNVCGEKDVRKENGEQLTQQESRPV